MNKYFDNFYISVVTRIAAEKFESYTKKFN